MTEHPNAAVVRRTYEARARGEAASPPDVHVLDARTPLSIAAAGDLAVVIDRAGDDVGVAVFRIVDGHVTNVRRLSP